MIMQFKFQMSAAQSASAASFWSGKLRLKTEIKAVKTVRRCETWLKTPDIYLE